MLSRRFSLCLSGAALVCGGAHATDADANAVVALLERLIRDNYVDAAKGETIAAGFATHRASGRYATLADPAALARMLTTDGQALSQDPHFAVLMETSPHPTAAGLRISIDGGGGPSAEALAGLKANHYFVATEILPGRIGKLTVTGFPFPWPEVTRYYGAAMTTLHDSLGLVIDLTATLGGDPNGTAHLASYFFDQTPFELNRIVWRGETPAKSYLTTRDLSGPSYGNGKPVAIAISKATFSAGEEFAYDLQARKRAVVVGEPSRGGAHMNAGFGLGLGLMALIPAAQAVNPVTGGNWNGTGVQPDITAAGKAVTVAHQTALTKALAQATDPGVRQELEDALKALAL